MKLKLLNLIHLSLIFALLFGNNYDNFNDIQINSLCSFVKLRVKASYNLQGKDDDKNKGEPKLLSVTLKSSPPPSPSSTRARTHRTTPRANQPFQRMPTWPPREGPRRPITGTPVTNPKPLSEKYEWPPKKVNRHSIQLGSTHITTRSPFQQYEDKEDLFTAIKVQVKEDIDESGISKLMITSDSDSDSDLSVPGTPTEKKMTLVKNENELTPEVASKVTRMKVKYEKIVRRKLDKGRIAELLNSSQLGKYILIIPIKLLIELLEKLLDYLTSSKLEIITSKEVENFDFAVKSSGGIQTAGTSFYSNLELGNRFIGDLKSNTRDKFRRKYDRSCNLVLLKELSKEYRNIYLEKADIDSKLSLISNPRLGNVENRGEKITEFYKILKELVSKLKTLEVKFLECFMSYFENLDITKIKNTKSEACTWPQLMLLHFYLTVFKAFQMLTREALSVFEEKIIEYEELVQKEKSLNESQTKKLSDLKPIMKKISKLRINDELFSMLSSTIPLVTHKCMNYLKSTT